MLRYVLRVVRRVNTSACSNTQATTKAKFALPPNLVALFDASVAEHGLRPFFGVYENLPEPHINWRFWTYNHTAAQVQRLPTLVLLIHLVAVVSVYV